MKPMLKQVIRTVAFLSICAALFLFFNHIFYAPVEAGSNMDHARRRFNALYLEPEGTWDGVLLGTSVADRAWVAPLAWREYGMTVYPLSTDSQPLFLCTDILDEVLKRQDVGFVALELHGIIMSSLNANETEVRRVTDSFRSTASRIRAADHAFEFVDGQFGEDSKLKGEEPWSYYFPFIKYHRDGEITWNEFSGQVHDLKGVYEVSAFVQEPQGHPELPEEEIPLLEAQRAVLDEIIAYVEEKGLGLFFVSVPSGHGTEEQAQVKAALKYVEEKGYPALDMNSDEVYRALELDFETDFYNEKHLNALGARKATRHIAQALAGQFTFEDKRGQAGYEDWDRADAAYESFFAEGLQGKALR